MSEQEISKLKKLHAEEKARIKQFYEDKVAKLQKAYAHEIKQMTDAHTKQHKHDQDRIAGLMTANLKLKGLDKNYTPKIPKSFKPHRAGGNPETN